MERPTTAQTHKLMSVLSNNVNWDDLDVATVQRIIEDPREAGAQFTTFLKNGARVIVGQPKIITINRSKPFNPVKFEGLGKRWTIWKGPLDGDGLGDGLKVDELQDTRSLALTEVDLEKVSLKNVFKQNEKWLRGREWFQRMTEGDGICLDAGAFLELWEKKYSIPESWKPFAVYFPGTVLRGPYGNACVLYFFWNDGAWGWGCRYLGDRFFAGRVGASLAS